MKKITIIIITFLLVIGVVTGAVLYKRPKNHEVTAKQTVENTKVVELTAQNGDTVLAATKRNSDVKYTESSSGALVNSINNLTNSSSEFWMYSINGISGSVAADRYFCKEGDIIKWEFKSF